MTNQTDEKYVTRTPLYEICTDVKNRQSPTMTFMSNQQVPGCDHYLQYGWVYDVPDPNPHVQEHSHDYDEILLFIGSNYKRPQVLGAEVDFSIGGQHIVLNTTSSMYIPAGTPHGPVVWKSVDQPHLLLSLVIGSGSAKEIWKDGAKSDDVQDFDYEQYVIRSPMRESGGFFTRARQSPTMSYMSRPQIGVANTYIEFGWIWDIPEPVEIMTHENFDEIVLHIGGDPKDPEDLGADMTFTVGGKEMAFDKNFGMFIPKNIEHGPLEWKAVRKPHIEMAIMLGCGTMKDGWGYSADEMEWKKQDYQEQIKKLEERKS